LRRCYHHIYYRREQLRVYGLTPQSVHCGLSAGGRLDRRFLSFCLGLAFGFLSCRHLQPPVGLAEGTKEEITSFFMTTTIAHCPHFTNGPIAGLCLNVTGLSEAGRRDYRRQQFPIHRMVVKWTKRRYHWLVRRQPKVAARRNGDSVFLERKLDVADPHPRARAARS
jgi:hypothetical protein